MQCHDFFLEIGCEELPSSCLQSLSEALEKNLVTQFELHRLKNAYQTHLFATPRRLAISVTQLPEIQYPQTSVKKNYNRETKTVESVNIDLPCEKTIDLLPSMVEKAIAALPMLKPMRWGNHDITFVRPVHWVAMIYNHAIVPATILGCQTTAETRGHRVHHPEGISLLDVLPESLPALYEKAYVIADFETRKKNIYQQLINTATKLHATLVFSEDLLNEVTGLVEWPVVLAIPFDNRFLDLPQEVLITSMQHHQKVFALRTDEHTAQLMPYFLMTVNIESTDLAKVIAGNERVMHARLSDAAFFYEKDKQQPLIERRDATQHVIFQAKLGTLYDKSERLMVLATYLASLVNFNAIDAQRAACLSQCDLMTDMVGEFPELQGIMGAYYARSSGESEAVACALNEQYWPRFSGDALPKTSLGTILAIAERVDTLIGAFSIHQKPTGNKDPFKLRRHALGLIRILIENATLKAVSVLDVLLYAFQHLPLAQQASNPKTVEETHLFILERLKAYYHEQDYASTVIQAVLSQQSAQLYDFHLRIQAIHAFSTWSEAPALAAANKRVSRILAAEKSVPASHDIDLTLLSEPAEKNLVTALQAQQQVLLPLLAKKEYTQALKTLASLRVPVDAFFDTVMVNVDDMALRQNRLAILVLLRQLFMTIADLSCLG